MIMIELLIRAKVRAMQDIGYAPVVAQTSLDGPLLSLDTTLAELTYIRRGHSPRHALLSAIAWREDLTPYLLDEAALAPVDVQARYDSITDSRSEYYLHTLAFFLLGHFRDPRGYHLLLDYFSSDSELAEELSGDLLGGYLPALLVSCYDGSNRRKLRLIIETTDFHPLFRSSCLKAYHGLALTGSCERAEVVALTRSLLLRAMAPDATCETFNTWLALAAAELQEPALQPEINALFDRGLVHIGNEVVGVVDKDDIARTYARRPQSIRAEILAESFFERMVDKICRWYWFQKPDPVRDPAERAIDAFDHDLPFVRAEPKVGRNDACPCGSGKKYKKCCMDRLQ